MSEKNQESKQPNETENESASSDTENTAPTSSDVLNDSTPFDGNLEEVAVEASLENQESTDLEDESSSEDLLDDVRRSLIEEDTDQNKKPTKWWRRIGRKEKSVAPESIPVEIDLPSTSLQTDHIEDQTQAKMPDEYAEQIDDLIDMLEVEPRESDAQPPSAAEMHIPPEPEPEVDFKQLKEQAFRPPTPDEEAQSDTDVRSIALGGEEEVFVEVEARRPDTFQERLKAFENALKPYRSYLYMTLTFLGIVLIGVLSLLIFNAYQQSRPQPVQEVSNLPYPVAVSLPGGWSFNLGRGTLQAGKWEPSGAEWLEGTEVCRWVSLPWSPQLEAVLRTLNQNDPVELVMSNNDKLTYSVYSIYQLTLEEIQALDSNSPCLLLILTGENSEKRWVLTAKP